MSWNLIEDPLVGPEVVRELMVGAPVTWDEEIDWSGAGQSVLDAADQLVESDWISSETGMKFSDMSRRPVSWM